MENRKQFNNKGTDNLHLKMSPGKRHPSLPNLIFFCRNKGTDNLYDKRKGAGYAKVTDQGGKRDRMLSCHEQDRGQEF